MLRFDKVNHVHGRVAIEPGFTMADEYLPHASRAVMATAGSPDITVFGYCLGGILSLLYVAGHPDTSAQAQRLGNVLKGAGVPVTLFGGRETTHTKINADLGLPDDPGTKALSEFLGKALKK